MRIACLYVPNFPLAALLRAEPEQRDHAVVVTNGPTARATVVAVSEAAARRGVSVGINATQARAIADSLVVRSLSDECRRATQAALCDAADSFSPRVEDAGEGVVYLDADGLSSLFPREQALAHALAQRAAHLGIEAHAGIAATKIAACLAARDGGGVTVIPPGEEWGVLAPLPVGLLQPSAELAATLRRWGIHTLGDLAALPAGAATRLGPEGAVLIRRARGEDAHPLVPRPAPMRFEESMELDYGIEMIEPFAFVARRLLERLTARLAVRGFVCGDVHLSLRLASRALDERTVPVAAPSNDVKALLTLLRLQLEAYPPPAAVEAIRLSAVSERLRAMQLHLFRPPGPAPERLAVTLARLTAICGADRVGAPLVVDSHRPDAYAIADFRLAIADSFQSAIRNRQSAIGTIANPKSAIALRAVRPPRPVQVFCDRGRLDYVRGEGLSGRVVMIAGPWRVQTDWWNEQASTRDYYDVQLSDGGVYRMYCERKTQEWFADGIYD